MSASDERDGERLLANLAELAAFDERLSALAAQIPPGCVCAEIDEKDRPCIACEAKAVLKAAPHAPEQR